MTIKKFRKRLFIIIFFFIIMAPNSVPKRGRGRPRKYTPIKELQSIHSTKVKRRYRKRNVPIPCAILTRSRSNPSVIECNPKHSSSDEKEVEVKKRRLGRENIVLEEEVQNTSIQSTSLKLNDDNLRVNEGKIVKFILN